MPAETTSAQLLGDLRRLARQRKPVELAECVQLLTRLLVACRTLTIEERANGIAIRLAGGAAGRFALTCFLHRPPAVELTTAESAVARELCAGRTLAQIAHLRGVSSNTVKSQVRQIFRKLDVESRVALVRMLGP